MRLFLFLCFISSFTLNLVFITNGAIKKVEEYVGIIQKHKDIVIDEIKKKLPVKQKLFEVDDSLKEKVSFWEKIYSKYCSNMSVIHDNKHLSIIYEVVDLRYLNQNNYTPVRKELIRKRLILKTRIKIVDALTKIEKLKRQKNFNINKLNDWEKQIYKKTFVVQNFDYRGAAKRIRQQTGQSDHVEKAMKRSEPYIHSMEKILVKNGIPKELVLLTFLESSFNIKAVSSVGAAGVWQIMPEMGRKFLTMNNLLDERKDPIKATRVAAIILKESYEKLNDWPLAITSYNVGWPRVRRALRKEKEKNIQTFLKGNHPRVGFSAKNFYAGFIAMLNVCLAKNKFFLDLDNNSSIKYRTISLKHDSRLRNILHGANIKLSEFKILNPEFANSIYLSKVKIPSGTKIKIPFKNNLNVNVLRKK